MKRFQWAIATMVVGVAAGGFIAGFTAARWRTGAETAVRGAHGLAPPPATMPESEQPGAGENVVPFHRGQAREFVESLRGFGNLKRRDAIAAAVAGMSLEDVQSISRELSGVNYSDQKAGELIGAVCDRWAELDPESLLKAAQISDGVLRYTGLKSALSVLAKQDPAALWERARGMNGQTSYFARQAVVQMLGESDPAAAMKLVTGSGNPDSAGAYAMSGIMAQWAGRDPQAASRAAQALPPGDFRTRMLTGIAESWGHADFKNAWAWVQALPSSREKQEALGRLVGVTASQDPQAALKLLDDSALGSQRGEALSNLVGIWAMRDFDAALQYSSNLDRLDDQKQALFSLVQNVTPAQREKLLQLAKTAPPALARAIYLSGLRGGYDDDPARSGAYAAEIPIGSLREEALSSVAQNLARRSPMIAADSFARLLPASQTAALAGNIGSGWAATDPDKAMQWAEGLGAFEQRKAALTAAIKTVAGSDPQAAAVRLASVSDPKLREALIAPLAEAWAQSDETAALKWAQSLDPVSRSAALGKLVESSLGSNPDEAQRLYVQFTAGLSPEQTDKPENRALAARIVTTLAESNPQQAREWLTSLPEGSARDEATSGLAGKWAGFDPAAASEWITTLPPGPGRDAAAGTLVGAIAGDDPERAWAWATSLSDSARRHAAAAQAIEGWKGKGASAAAAKALQAGDFTPEERFELLKKLE